MTELHIAPNKPVTVALQDPEGQYDFSRERGHYQTTAGESLTLPRPAVVLLNELDPRPGEEIVIQKHWSGRPKDKARWTIALSTRAEKVRAEAGEPDRLTEQLEASIEQAKRQKASQQPPTPITRPSTRRKPAAQEQPRLFDRGTGTDGPAPLILPAAAVLGNRKPGQIPANVAIKEILQFITQDPNTRNWSDQAVQDLCSTAYISAVKQGWVGLWERPE